MSRPQWSRRRPANGQPTARRRPHHRRSTSWAGSAADSIDGMRRGWWFVMLVAIALVPILILLVFEGGSDPAVPEKIQTKPLVVGDITVVGSDHIAGSLIAMTVVLRADRDISLNGLEIDLHRRNDSLDDPAAAVFKPSSTPRRITPERMTLVLSGTVAKAGTYYYNLSYRAAGSTGSPGTWQRLPPYQTLTVS